MKYDQNDTIGLEALGYVIFFLRSRIYYNRDMANSSSIVSSIQIIVLYKL